jgi:dTDP-glucose 4,6-dehydratase
MAETNPKTVLVTGAAGFIASHLCERLVESGHEVRAMCRYTSRRELGNLTQVPAAVREALDIRWGDLRDSEFVTRSARGCDSVIHLGASISVPYSFDSPRDVVSTNVEGTLNVLTATREAELGSMVHLSSSEVYGTAQYAPIDEAHPLHVQSPYAASKVGADKLCESYARALEVPVVIARPFNTYGPRQSLRAVIPTVITQAIRGDRVVLGDTRPSRDFVFVRDTADALIALAGAEPSVAGETFNIATGKDIPVVDLVALVGELLGRELVIESESERLRPGKSEVFRLQGDATKIRDWLGWQPRTSLRDGLAEVIAWAEESGVASGETYVV